MDRGRFTLPDDFDAPLADELQDAFEGADDATRAVDVDSTVGQVDYVID